MPVETTKEMQKRIKRDYQLMDQVYKKQVGAVPDLYCIMHSNTSSYGDNANVSSANAASLEKMFKLNCEFLGNKIGQQTVYLKTQGTASGKHNFASYLSLSLENNILYLRQKQGGAIKTLYKVDMFKLEDDKPVSVPKDKRAALSSELNVRGRFAQNSTTAALYKLKAFKKKRQKAKSVKEGAKEYVPEIQIQDPGDVKAELTVKGSSLTLTVNGQKLCQRNIADDVCDGAFKDLVITSPDGERVYYDNRLPGWELVSYHWKHFWNKVIDWFINNL